MLQGPLGFFFAFIVVLALIGAAAWLVRRFAGNRLGATAKGGRLPRLAVIDATAVDGRRRLVLVRRDNVEHLLMIGGPTDIVVEPNIVRAAPVRDQSRSSALPDPANWTDNEPPRAESLDFNEPPMAEPPPPRPQRPSFVEEARRTPAAMPERRERGDARGDNFGGFVPEPMLRPSPDMRAPEMRPAPEIRPDPPSRPARSEPMMPRPVRSTEPAPLKAPPVRAPERAAPAAAAAPAVAAAAASSADQNLAEMAQRLEAALRRPGGDPRPASPPMSAPTSPPMAPDANAGRPARSISEVKVESMPAAAETSSAPPVASPKASFEDLEEEMASLLGRPKNTS